MEMHQERFCDLNIAPEVVFMKLICMSLESKNHKSEIQNPLRILPLIYFLMELVCSNAHIPNIHALNSDTHTLFLSILTLNSQCVGVAIEGMDIWYIRVTGFRVPEK